MKNGGNRIPALLTAVVFVFLTGFTVWFGWSAFSDAVGYRQSTLELIEATNVESRWSRNVADWLSLGLSDRKARELARIEQLQLSAEAQKGRAQAHFLAFLGISLVGIGLVFLLQRRRSVLALAMLVVSFVALVVGLLAPAMAVKAVKELPVLGQVVLYFQSKGVWSTIMELFKPGGSLFIGIPILLFSVVIPVLKTAVLIAAVAFSRNRRIRGLSLAHRIGKWSMADVCVISWLLAFMATERQEFMKAELQVGILFFATYAMLSIAAGLLVEQEYRRQQPGNS